MSDKIRFCHQIGVIISGARWPGASVAATIDGLDVPSLQRYQVQSLLFNVTFPKNSLFGAPGGLTHAVSGSWWLLLNLFHLENLRFTQVEILLIILLPVNKVLPPK